MRKVAALYVRGDSIYKTRPGCICFDVDQDARTFPGGIPVVAHPPCRAWGRLRHFADPAPGEKDLALLAVAQVRAAGGVLEHPASSTLWLAADLPRPGEFADAWGGYTIEVNQYWFGHRAEKRTWLYIVGVARDELPRYRVDNSRPSHVVENNSRTPKDKRRPAITKREREATPAAFADWLIDLARRSSTACQND